MRPLFYFLFIKKGPYIFAQGREDTRHEIWPQYVAWFEFVCKINIGYPGYPKHAWSTLLLRVLLMLVCRWFIMTLLKSQEHNILCKTFESPRIWRRNFTEHQGCLIVKLGSRAHGLSSREHLSELLSAAAARVSEEQRWVKSQWKPIFPPFSRSHCFYCGPSWRSSQSSSYTQYLSFCRERHLA